MLVEVHIGVSRHVCIRLYPAVSMHLCNYAWMMIGLETEVNKCQKKHRSSQFDHDDEIIDPEMTALKMMLPEMIIVALNTQVTRMLKLLTNQANTFLLPIITHGVVRSSIESCTTCK